jgi:hypothetical protein
MTSPALLYLSLDTPSIHGAVTALWLPPESPAGSYTPIKANPPDASGVTPRCSWPARTCPGSPRAELGALPALSKPRGATTGWSARCCADSPDGKPVTT